MNEEPDQAEGAGWVPRGGATGGEVQQEDGRDSVAETEQDSSLPVSPLLERPLLDTRQTAEARVESSDLKCLQLLNLLSTYCVPACSGHQGLNKQFAPAFAGLI